MDHSLLSINVTSAVRWQYGNVDAHTFASHATVASHASISAALGLRIVPWGLLIRPMAHRQQILSLAALPALAVMTKMKSTQAQTTLTTAAILVEMTILTSILKLNFLSSTAYSIVFVGTPSVRNPS